VKFLGGGGYFLRNEVFSGNDVFWEGGIALFVTKSRKIQ